MKVSGAIVFTDIVASSKLWKKNPKEMFIKLGIHDNLIKEITEELDGEVVKQIGDSFMIYFKTPENSFKFAHELQRSMSKNKIKIDNLHMKITIGIAIGTFNKKRIEIQGCELNDYFGEIVNIASRMESKVASIGGIGIYISDKWKYLIKKVKNLAKKGYTINEYHYFDDCNDLKMRLVSPECRLASELHGVGELIAFNLSPRN